MRRRTKNSLLATIHIAKKDLGLPDDVYRDMLERVTGKRSAALCNVAQLERMEKELEAKGWVSKPTKARTPRVRPENKPVISKIGAIIAELDLPWAYAHGIGKRMFGTEKLEWLRFEQCHAVLVALIKKQAAARGAKS